MNDGVERVDVRRYTIGLGAPWGWERRYDQLCLTGFGTFRVRFLDTPKRVRWPGVSSMLSRLPPLPHPHYLGDTMLRPPVPLARETLVGQWTESVATGGLLPKLKR